MLKCLDFINEKLTDDLKKYSYYNYCSVAFHIISGLSNS